VLGVMNQMALEIGWHADRAGVLGNIEVDELNRHLRHSRHTKNGDYRIRLELVQNDSKAAGKNLSTRIPKRTPDAELGQPRPQAPRPEFPAPTGYAEAIDGYAEAITLAGDPLITPARVLVRKA
jgi:hypothetical protein